MATPAILLLEDADERIRRFHATLQRIAPHHHVHTYQTAHGFIAALPTLLPATALISLDHDLLLPGSNGEDPGDGLDAARALATFPPTCPILIHSSNADRTHRMRGTLELEHWPVHTVLPFGENWIERYWADKIIELLGTDK